MKRLSAIMKQRDKLIKEGKYTPPPHHLGKEDSKLWAEQLLMAGADFLVYSSPLES